MLLSISNKTKATETVYRRTETKSLLDFANENRKAGLFTDVTICAENQRFPANKMVLSCYSTYFKTMFTTKMRERYQNSVEIENVDADSMNSIIEYIYTGNLPINKNNVCNLLSASDYFQIEDAKQFCFDFLKSAITADSCFTLLAIADLYGNDLLANDVKQFVAKNFDEVICSKEFKSISKEHLISSVLSQNRSSAQEVSIYNGVMEWIKHDEENRDSDIFELLQLVSLDKLSVEFLVDTVSNEDVIKKSHPSLQLVNKIIASQFKNKLFGTKIFSVGTKDEKTGKRVIEVYSTSKKSDNVFPDLPSRRFGGVCLKLHDVVYYVGGSTTDKDADATNSVLKINTKNDVLEWEEIAEMNDRRSLFGATVLNDTLVVVGGRNVTFLSSGEYYSSLFNKWENISPMKKNRYGHALVACKGRLYAIGGYSDEYLSSVECLSIDDGKWKDVKSMQTARLFLTSVNYNDDIYAIGGMSGSGNETKLKSAEKYDVVKNEWKYISDMNFARDGCSACVMQGKIYVVGGFDENKAVKAIECYDPLKDIWTVVGNSDEDLFYHSLVLV